MPTWALATSHEHPKRVSLCVDCPGCGGERIEVAQQSDRGGVAVVMGVARVRRLPA